MFRIFKGYQTQGFAMCPKEGKRRFPVIIVCTFPPLHAKVVIISDTSTKRRLTWGNGRNVERGPAVIGLQTEQVSLNRPRG